MTTRFSVVHRTEYQYGLPMSDGYTVAHLLPRDTPTQRVVSAEIQVTPDPDEYEEHIDLFGNRVVRIGVHHPHDHLDAYHHGAMQRAAYGRAGNQ